MKLFLVLLTTIFLSINSFLNGNPVTTHSIIDPAGQISDFDARFELAKVLSRDKDKREKSLEQYVILIKEHPQDAKLWFEISRLYISDGKFIEALPILEAIVYKKPLNFNFSINHLRGVEKEKLSIDSSTLIELSAQISDDQTRLELARIYSRNKKRVNEAITLYQFLLQKKPHDAKLLLELSRIYIGQKNYRMALSYLYFALDYYPDHIDLLIEAARAELSLGHPKQSENLYRKALTNNGCKESLLLEFADVLMFVGSFYEAEAIYESVLKTKPHSLKVALKLAWAFVSAQRYEEAEGIYRKLLLCHPHQPKILNSLVDLKMIQKDFESALEIAQELYNSFPDNPNFLQLIAESQYKLENYPEALDTFESLKGDGQNSDNSFLCSTKVGLSNQGFNKGNHEEKELQSEASKFYTKAKIGIGRTYLKLGEICRAEESFQDAYNSDPSSIQSQFYQAGGQVCEEDFIQKIISKTEDPNELVEWANVYSENGIGGVIDFYEAALEIDPDYFQAQTGLAQALNFHFRYEEAFEIYLSQLASFPNSSKILMEIARTLSWWKNYEDSMKWYDQIILLNPQDPVPRREKARVANWGKFFKKSMETYQELLNPTVDQLLVDALQKVDSEPFVNFCLESLLKYVESGTIYAGYEALCLLESNEKTLIESLLVDYLPAYLIQKSILLESRAKALDWQNDYLHALPIYQELAEFSPGNEEGLFGYAQDFCSLGLCNCSRKLYRHILNLDPNHNIVNFALERNLRKENSLVQANYTYWTERGSGQFSNSQIARHQFDQVYEWSPRCNQQFRFMQSEWIEYPFFNEEYYPAEGQTIEVNHLFNSWVKGVASASFKNYFNRFPSRYTCLATLFFNLYDYSKLELGFERKNEIYNYFTLKQGIQAKIYWASLKTNSHSWNLAATYRHLDYNDGNALDHANLLLSYALTEDPTIFKIILDGSYRNAAHLTEIIISPVGKIVDIIHPYWTPRDYFSGSITLEFRYNYAWFNYCEAPQRYIDFKLTGEADNAKNPSIQLAINWKHEFMCHWGFEMTGLYHRSRLWNAEGIWTQVYYRF